MVWTSTRLTSIKAMVLGSVLVIAGCAGVVVGKTPSTTFDVPISIQRAYERTIAQAKYCLVTKDDFPLTAQISADQQSASVDVRMSMTGTLLADIELTSVSAEKTNVSISMWGVSGWDQAAINAMKAAIQFGVPSCTDYFPTVSPPKGTRR
jgi:hypothetical protein